MRRGVRFGERHRHLEQRAGQIRCPAHTTGPNLGITASRAPSIPLHGCGPYGALRQGDFRRIAILFRQYHEDAGPGRLLNRCPADAISPTGRGPPGVVVPADPRQVNLGRIHGGEIGADEAVGCISQIVMSFIEVAVKFAGTVPGADEGAVSGAVDGEAAGPGVSAFKVAFEGEGADESESDSGAEIKVAGAGVGEDTFEGAVEGEGAGVGDASGVGAVEVAEQGALVEERALAEEGEDVIQSTGKRFGVAVDSLQDLCEFKEVLASLEPFMWRHGLPPSCRVSQGRPHHAVPLCTAGLGHMTGRADTVKSRAGSSSQHRSWTKRNRTVVMGQRFGRR